VNVFICWSGVASEAVAKVLHQWLRDVVQELRPFMSDESIRQGDRWRQEIATKLGDTHYGILCVTKDNLDSRWMLFEAGALSKNVEAGRVTALLIGVEPRDITEPLSQFQHTTTDKEKVLKLVAELNALLPAGRSLDPERLKRAFDVNWPWLEEALKTAASGASTRSAPKHRADSDVLEEILVLTRQLSRGRDEEDRAREVRLIELEARYHEAESRGAMLEEHRRRLQQEVAMLQRRSEVQQARLDAQQASEGQKTSGRRPSDK